jgi:hypothetical protein
MRIIRRAAAPVVTIAAALVVAGCGASGPSAEEDEAAVATLFRSYHAALLARDFVTACALNAPETSVELIRNVNAQAGTAATCEEALTAVYAGAGAPVADRVSTSAQVQEVDITGDTATLTWTFDNQGRVESVDTGLRRIHGQWRLLAGA